ncbi:MAG: D-cysteine desulfhydrase, partial [Thermodesulfobacteriota bacterium]
MKLSALPRVRLANLPTPLQELPNLSRTLKGPRIFVKRDDMTGLAFGGNKTRKLEYLMPGALKSK